MSSNPLTKAELTFIEDILDKYGNDASILSVSELDGFLTAIVSGPEMVLPSQWLPMLWGGPNEEPEWESEEEFKAFFSLTMQHMNNNAEMLTEYPDEFEALFFRRNANGKVYRIVDDWCEGYLKGVALTADAWLQLPESMLDEHLSVMYVFGSDDHSHMLDELPEKGIAKLQDAIEPAARAIHAFFLEKRLHEHRPANEPSMTISQSPKVGRNDPCACGSGKKYKKCCLH